MLDGKTSYEEKQTYGEDITWVSITWVSDTLKLCDALFHNGV